ncbi:MAG: trigger factor [Lachnospiraceae bacterium]|jgi:trigger factor|nr:trigger factor [Lachnospiraceae bacterium]
MRNRKRWQWTAAFILSMALAVGGCGKKEEPVQDKTQTGVEENSGTETGEEAGAGTEGATKLLALGDYKSIQVQAMDTEPTEEEEQREMDTLLEGYAELVEVEGKTVIEEGDVVNLDFRGLIDGEPFEGGTSGEGGYDLTIGSGKFIKGFEEQLVGKELGKSYDLDLAFPENYGNPELNGKPVVFQVTINKIQEKIVPELTDTFVQENLEYDSVEALKTGIREELRTQKEAVALDKKYSDVLTALVEASSFEVSQAEIEAEKSRIISSNETMAAAYGIDLETYLLYFMNGISVEEFERQCETTADIRIKASLVVEAVAEAEAITMSDQEYTQEAEAMMGQYGFTSLEEFEAAYTKEVILDNLIYDKTMDFLIGLAKEV